jgi:hypothetical protein
MPASPALADTGWDDDLAWLDRDPMTAAERLASLDRLCEQDEGYREDEATSTGTSSRDARRAANRLVLGMKGLAYALCRRAPSHGTAFCSTGCPR